MILMYHNIGITAGFNTVSVSELEKQLLYLKNNFDVLSPDDYLAKLGTGRSSVLITADDAYLSFKDLFYPLLKKYNFPALLFVPTGFVGKHNEWDTECKIDIMEWEDIRCLSSEGLISIGSHGISHTRFSALSDDKITEELIGSKKLLEEKINRPVIYFGYPYGQLCDYNSFTVRNIKKSGYEFAFSTRYGLINKLSDRFELKRIEIEPKDDIVSFRHKCEKRFHIKLFKRYIKESLLKTGLL